ncbi:TIGR01244 family sulfur transferase [Sphingomicrobium astaxanthinifaciens]|uniref:TIGR01244 family sulfur transferase n=1 Tax=Sphingomicrobium astaxanthinifaciens TaxID=1227949 RepID=UPI001FCAAA20|nr:TIGR01244 family sulfur transferase [Sphingomicrobium astaxanthinifaciens]MCJ7421238.1 TIGR01244 family sulfur transferase [Sphingomicrobium astaxanthinifaciens]
MILKKVPLDGDFHVGSQMGLDDVETLRAEGYGMVICNRPDHEEEDQPTAAALEAACKDAGIRFAHVPIGRGISPADVAAECEALDAAGDAKTFAFCRSGTRSTLLWALAHHERGRPIADLRETAAEAGYSLDPINHLL